MPTHHKKQNALSRLRIHRKDFRATTSDSKSETMRMRVTPQQKADIVADAESLGVSATELLLQLHRIASPSLRKKVRR